MVSEWLEAWGVTGRSKEFRLRGGGQFEYSYLIMDQDGRMYLLAEYAYA
jgi:transposase